MRLNLKRGSLLKRLKKDQHEAFLNGRIIKSEMARKDRNLKSGKSKKVPKQDIAEKQRQMDEIDVLFKYRMDNCVMPSGRATIENLAVAHRIPLPN